MILSNSALQADIISKNSWVDTFFKNFLHLGLSPTWIARFLIPKSWSNPQLHGKFYRQWATKRHWGTPKMGGEQLDSPLFATCLARGEVAKRGKFCRFLQFFATATPKIRVLLPHVHFWKTGLNGQRQKVCAPQFVIYVFFVNKVY